jgi:hypothetical protein
MDNVIKLSQCDFFNATPLGFLVSSTFWFCYNNISPLGLKSRRDVIIIDNDLKNQRANPEGVILSLIKILNLMTLPNVAGFYLC